MPKVTWGDRWCIFYPKNYTTDRWTGKGLRRSSQGNTARRLHRDYPDLWSMNLWAGPATPGDKNLPNKDFKETFGVNGAEFSSKPIMDFLWFKSLGILYRMSLGWIWASILGHTYVHTDHRTSCDYLTNCWTLTSGTLLTQVLMLTVP